MSYLECKFLRININKAFIFLIHVYERKKAVIKQDVICIYIDFFFFVGEKEMSHQGKKLIGTYAINTEVVTEHNLDWKSFYKGGKIESSDRIFYVVIILSLLFCYIFHIHSTFIEMKLTF
jgi:hypothetical protein